VGEDDPPAIACLTRLGPHDLYRLVYMTGLAKCSAAPKLPETGDPHPLSPRDRDRLQRLRRLRGKLDPRLVQVAIWDLDEIAEVKDRTLPPLGLITVGRLLAACEPYRTRWAL